MTTKGKLREWLKAAEKNHTHMIVVCDTYDHEDYPVYVEEGEDVREKEAEYQKERNMQRVMEVYNLRLPFEPQLAERRAFNY